MQLKINTLNQTKFIAYNVKTLKFRRRILLRDIVRFMSNPRTNVNRPSRLNHQLDQFGLNKFSSNTASLVLFISLLYTTVRYSSEIVAGGHPYLTGDWLINYAGGYSGRGLNGQLLLQFSNLTGLDLLWVAYFEQIGIYSIYVLIVIRLLRKVHDKFLWMISLSPLFIMFDFLDTGGAFRKEIIGFASLALFVRMLMIKKFTWISFLPVVFLYLLSAFSWEASIIFLLPMLYFTHKMKLSGLLEKSQFIGISLLYSIISFSSLMASFIFQLASSKDQSRAVCDSIVAKGISPKICDGTIFSVTGLKIDIPETLHFLLVENDYSYYFPILIFALLPFIWNGWIKQHPILNTYFFISVLPIFLIGLDWGRWIHILGTIITLAWIAEKSQNSEARHEHRGRAGALIFPMLTVLFIALWRIPHAGGLPGAFLFGAAARLLSWI